MEELLSNHLSSFSDYLGHKHIHTYAQTFSVFINIINIIYRYMIWKIHKKRKNVNFNDFEFNVNSFVCLACFLYHWLCRINLDKNFLNFKIVTRNWGVERTLHFYMLLGYMCVCQQTSLQERTRTLPPIYRSIWGSQCAPLFTLTYFPSCKKIYSHRGVFRFIFNCQ